MRRKEKNWRILDESQKLRVIKYLTNLSKPKYEKRYTVPGYETVEYLSQKAECIELLARPLGIKGKGLNRLRVFRFIQESEKERERLRKRALNTLNAVRQIQDKTYIHEVSIMTLESGDIVEISNWTDAGT